MNQIESSYPKKVYIETTTRCNLKCEMCVKYKPGSDIVEKDLPFTLFESIKPALKQANALILNGIGEPLLHPELLKIVQAAHAVMPQSSTIGFQSNGLLLTESLAEQLLKSGLTTLCLSMDEMDSNLQCNNKQGHSFNAVNRAILNLKAARERQGKPFSIGLETVLTKHNITQLPELIKWAALNGVDYILTSHLILYDDTDDNHTLFNPNSDTAVVLFNKYNDQAASLGLDLQNGYASFLRRTSKDLRLKEFDIFTSLHNEARTTGVSLNLESLFSQKKREYLAAPELLLQAKTVAEEMGIELYLPPLNALDEKECHFIKDNAVFVDSSGDVMPCHFLWHSYICRALDENIQVTKRVMGSLVEDDLVAIWQKENYVQFREEAAQSHYAHCWNCPSGPCSDLINAADEFANDCHGSHVPCGHCQWSLGGARCL